MMKPMSWLAALLLALPLVLSAQLISADELAAELENPKLVILDVRNEPNAQGSFMEQGHIPGSRFISWGHVTTTENDVPGMLPDANRFQTLMQSLGVNNDSKVVIVTQGETPAQFGWGTRLYWTLKVYGFDNAYILNGGLVDWKDMVGTVSNDAPPRRLPRGNFAAKDADMSIYASAQQVKDAIGKVTIVDARNIDQYLGNKPGHAKQPGHVKGAKAMPNQLYFSSGTLFKSPEQIRQTMQNLRISTDGPIIAHCNTAHLASIAWYAFHEVAGIPTRLYDGSMAEWDGPVSSVLEN